MRTLAVLLAVLAGCGTPDPEPLACDDPAAPTWSNFAQGYVQTWCTSCHSATLGGEDRQGAPAGLDFDTYAEVAAAAAEIRIWATGERPAMPPLGGTDPADVERLAHWLDCGAQGEDPAPDYCDSASAVDSLVVGSQAGADAVCDGEPRVVAGSLTIEADVVMDCICGVEGALVVTSAAARLARVATVLDGVAVTGGESGASLVAPALRHVEGDLTVRGTVTELDLTGLDRVAGEVRMLDVAGPVEVALLGLQEADALVVEGLTGVERLRLPRLRRVAGELVVRDAPDLRELAETNAVVSVGGDLVLESLGVDTFDHWTFTFLEHVGGSVRVVGNPRATELGGFTLLGDPGSGDTNALGGSLVIEGNPALRSISGFDTLPSVPGDLLVRDNEGLERAQGFRNLAQVGGDLRFERLPTLVALEAFPELATVSGTFALRELTALGTARGSTALRTLGGLQLDQLSEATNLEALDGVQAIQGDLAITANARVEDLSFLRSVRSVDGDVVVRDNGTLPRAVIDAWLEELGAENITGTVTVDGNAP